MNRKAFTLIELLAVIVILAIIALIAVPIVLNIIDDSKKSSQKESIKLYLDTVEKAIAKRQMEKPMFNPTECIINEKNIKCGEEEIEIDIQGEIPSEGIITFGKGMIINGINLKLNELYFQVSNGEVSEGSIEQKYALLVSDVDKNGEVSIGDKYIYQVNATTVFTFYVLSIEGENVNLIMDRNICSDGTAATASNLCMVAWYDDVDNPVNYSNDTNEFGPVTAMEGIYNATKNWNNVPDMDLDYSDEGHIADNSYGYWKVETTTSGIKITKKDDVEVTGPNNQTPVIVYEEGKSLKARLPKLEEVYNTGTDANHCHNNNGTCPAWLTNGLESYTGYYQENDHILGLKGYWLLSSSPGSADVRIVYYLGNGNTKSSTSNVITLGLRPVIAVPISNLS